MDYSIFEFTRVIFNERLFNNLAYENLNSKYDDPTLFMIDMNTEDLTSMHDKLNLIGMRNILFSLVDQGVRNDYNKIYSILNEALINDKHQLKLFYALVLDTIDTFISEFPKCTWLRHYEIVIDSLKYFKEQLASIYKIEGDTSKVITHAPSQINLPDNFTLVDIKLNFTPKLTCSQAGILLYYLRDEGHIAPYSDNALAKITSNLVGFSSQKLRVNLSVGEVMKATSEDKETVKAALLNVIRQITENK